MKQYSHTFVSFVLLAIVTTGCNNQPQNPPSDIATPVSVTELKKGSISKLINTTGTAQPTYGVDLNSEMRVCTNSRSTRRQEDLSNWATWSLKDS